MENKGFSIYTPNGLFVTNAETDALDTTLKTIGQGALYEKIATSQQEILKKLAMNETDKGKLTIEISFTKKDDDETVSISGQVKTSVGAKAYTSSSFITKDFLPSRNRQESITNG